MFIERLYQQKPCVFSIEVFPPKQTANIQKLYSALEEMAKLNPDFISVTYGAGGRNLGVSTCEIASHIQNDLHINALAHLTCVGATPESIAKALGDLHAAGVHNVLALRGDANPDLPFSKEYPHASDLAEAITQRGGFDIAGACYPEGHVECPTLAEDVENLKKKVDAGVSHLITQLFFDNVHYYRFLNLARKKGIQVPVSAGVMPIVSRSQIERTVALSSASLPPKVTKMVSRWQGGEQGVYEAGIEYAVEQLRDLISGGADGVHLYAMNRSAVAARVYEGIQDLL